MVGKNEFSSALVAKNKGFFMKKGFALIEILLIMILIGVLTVIAVGQYRSVIEKNCGAEPRAILPLVRYQALAYRIDKGTLAGFTPANGGIGTSNDQAPILSSPCRQSHFFRYSIVPADPVITITATRCTAGGKTPRGALARTLRLTANLATRVDTWDGNGNY